MRVTRPKETAKGLKVASIIEAGPYFGGTVDTPYHPADVTDRPRLAAWAPPAGPWKAPNYSRVYYDNYFVSRGYAVLAASTLGTGDSTGCPSAVGPEETTAMKTVIQWLTGGAKAYAADGSPVTAAWSTHDVAMAGKSYDGTLPLSTAATGVAGLKTVVSMSGVASWYDYYRGNGGVIAPGGYVGEDADLHAKVVLTRATPPSAPRSMHDIERRMDRVSGDYNAFWDERNFATDAGRFRATVFVTGGLNDWNVKPNQFLNLWQALGHAGVPRKLWIHQARHDDPIDVRRAGLARHAQPLVHPLAVRRRERRHVRAEGRPRAFTGAVDHRRRLAGPRRPYGHPAARGGRRARSATVPSWAHGVQPSAVLPGTLTHAADARQSFVDAPSRTAEQLAATPVQADPNRLIYLTPAAHQKHAPQRHTRGTDHRLGGRKIAVPVRGARRLRHGHPLHGFATAGGQWCYGDSIPAPTRDAARPGTM